MNDQPKVGEKPTVIDLGKVCQSLRVTYNFMDEVPTGYLFLTNCYIENGSETTIKHGPHPRMTYFKLTKNDLLKDKIDLKK